MTRLNDLFKAMYLVLQADKKNKGAAITQVKVILTEELRRFENDKQHALIDILLDPKLNTQQFQAYQLTLAYECMQTLDSSCSPGDLERYHQDFIALWQKYIEQNTREIQGCIIRNTGDLPQLAKEINSWPSVVRGQWWKMAEDVSWESDGDLTKPAGSYYKNPRVDSIREQVLLHLEKDEPSIEKYWLKLIELQPNNLTYRAKLREVLCDSVDVDFCLDDPASLSESVSQFVSKRVNEETNKLKAFYRKYYERVAKNNGKNTPEVFNEQKEGAEFTNVIEAVLELKKREKNIKQEYENEIRDFKLYEGFFVGRNQGFFSKNQVDLQSDNAEFDEHKKSCFPCGG